MVQRRENDKIHRMGYQNIRGTTLNSGLEIVDGLDANIKYLLVIYQISTMVEQ